MHKGYIVVILQKNLNTFLFLKKDHLKNSVNWSFLHLLVFHHIYTIEDEPIRLFHLFGYLCLVCAINFSTLILFFGYRHENYLSVVNPYFHEGTLIKVKSNYFNILLSIVDLATFRNRQNFGKQGEKGGDFSAEAF